MNIESEPNYLPYRFLTESSLSKLNFEQKIYEGDHSTLYKTSSIEDKTDLFAVKIYNSNKAAQKFFKNEKRFVGFQHKNICFPIYSEDKVEFLQNEQISTCSVIVYPFIPGQTLLEVFQKRVELDSECKKNIFKQILEAMDFLHTHKIVHLDLKPANIMIYGDFEISLIDFDLSAFEGENMLGQGTDFFRSPEIKNGSVESRFECDLFSIGMVLLVLCGKSIQKAQKLPWMDEEEFMSKMMQNPREVWDDATERGEDEIAGQVFVGLTKFVPESRMSISSLIQCF